MDNFFDLWDVFVNELVGDVWLFVFIGLIIIYFLCAKLRISTPGSFILSTLFLAIMFAQTRSLTAVCAFLILGVGALFYHKYQRAGNRG